MFRWALNFVLVAVLSIGVLTFVASRASLFYRGYNKAVEDRAAHNYVVQQCESHSDWLRFKPDMCAEANFEAQRSPWTIAAEYTLANTHSCGQWTCTSLYGMILEKTNNTLFNVALASGALVLLYALVLRIMGTALQTASAKNYAYLAHGAPSYIEGGPNAYTSYVVDNTHPQFHARRRNQYHEPANFYMTPESNYLRILNSET